MSKNLINLNSEELYLLIKSKINNQIDEEKKHEKLSSQEYLFTQEEIFCSKKFISFDINNLNEWLSAEFGTDINRKKILSPKIMSSFCSCDLEQKRTGIEIKDKIFCSNDSINYKIVNNYIKSTFLLKGESDFWVFLHTNGKFEEGTVVILFSKLQFCQTVFMSLGIIMKNDDNENEKDKKYFFRIFQTLQLVETYNKNNNDYIMNKKYESADSSMIKINVTDDGSEKIKVSAWINEGDAENILNGNFYFPVNMNNKRSDIGNMRFDISSENYKIMFAGSGESCERGIWKH